MITNLVCAFTQSSELLTSSNAYHSMQQLSLHRSIVGRRLRTLGYTGWKESTSIEVEWQYRKF